MNLQPIPGVSDRINQIRILTAEIVNREIFPTRTTCGAGAATTGAAYSIGAASLFGVVAPNSGNQKILLKYGTVVHLQRKGRGLPDRDVPHRRRRGCRSAR